MAGEFDAPSLARLSTFITNRSSELGPLIKVEKFPGGQSNPTYKVMCENGRCVLRRKPFGELLPRAHMIEREYRVMAAMESTGVPAPRMIAFCDDRSIIGAEFFLMEMVDGRIFWDPRLPDQSPEDRAAIYDAMNAAVAALHAIRPQDRGLSDFGRAQGFMARQVKLWTTQYRAAELRPIPAMDRLIEWLPSRLPPEQTEPRVFHGDLRLDNMIFHPTEPRILALLDWELSTIGDPLADLAYHAMTWRIPPELFRGLAGVDHTASGIPAEAQYLSTYLQRTQTDDLGDWGFYLAFSLFRVASILQGVAKRASQGNASAADAAEVGARAEPLAEIGWAIATGGP